MRWATNAATGRPPAIESCPRAVAGATATSAVPVVGATRPLATVCGERRPAGCSPLGNDVAVTPAMASIATPCLDPGQRPRSRPDHRKRHAAGGGELLLQKFRLFR